MGLPHQVARAELGYSHGRALVTEIKAVIEDSRSDKLGSLETAFSIWEMALVPMLL